jgi:hypothetical protein
LSSPLRRYSRIRSADCFKLSFDGCLSSSSELEGFASSFSNSSGFFFLHFEMWVERLFSWGSFSSSSKVISAPSAIRSKRLILNYSWESVLSVEINVQDIHIANFALELPKLLFSVLDWDRVTEIVHTLVSRPSPSQLCSVSFFELPECCLAIRLIAWINFNRFGCLLAWLI